MIGNLCNLMSALFSYDAGVASFCKHYSVSSNGSLSRTHLAAGVQMWVLEQERQLVWLECNL